MARVCALEECDVDLDEIGMKKTAKHCSGAHRAEASKRRRDPARNGADVFWHSLRGRAARRRSTTLLLAPKVGAVTP